MKKTTTVNWEHALGTVKVYVQIQDHKADATITIANSTCPFYVTNANDLLLLMDALYDMRNDRNVMEDLLPCCNESGHTKRSMM